MATFETSCTIQCSPETAFDFLIRPENVQRIAPKQLALTLVSAPDILTDGCRIEASLAGQKLVLEVVLWSPPLQWTDRQIEGPFKSLEHSHSFEAVSEGVRVSERIEFAPPGGLAGMVFNESLIVSTFEKGFAEQHANLKACLESGTS